ncbi:MAG: DUF2089 domain-containing protein [Anaerolineae bacterium]
MYPVPAKCPVCQGDLYVERLICQQCGTSLEGAFTLQRLARLTPEQWSFVETFLSCEGKLNRVQEELDLSYPTVRSRLNDVIRSLGYEVGAPDEEEIQERTAVLDQLSEGAITVEEALQLLKKSS